MRRLYPRGEEEFGRVLAFSDGVFAIAMTLLVVGIALPTVQDGSDSRELLEQLGEAVPEIISYFLSFAVVGRYWVAHHQFFGRLKALDGGLIAINLVSLGFVAFLPFPTDVLGNYFENPVSIVFYALAVATVSGLEVMMFTRAHRHGLLQRPIAEDVFRWGRAASLSPVLFFLLSVPLAFVHPVVAVAMWFGAVPYQALWLNRRKPVGAEALSQ